jgi:hypothetical protein
MFVTGIEGWGAETGRNDDVSNGWSDGIGVGVWNVYDTGDGVNPVLVS